jgi:hypothetical protein
VLPPLPTAVLVLLLARRPVLAGAAAALAVRRVDRELHDGLASTGAVAGATAGTALGLGRALALLGPLAWSAALRDRRAALVLLAPVAHEWWRAPHRERPGRFVRRVLLEEAAYGAGVLAGCLRHRTLGPLVPRTRV